MMSKACDLAVCVQIAFLPTEGVFLAKKLIANMFSGEGSCGAGW